MCGGNVAVEGAVVAVWLAHASKSAERRKGCGELGSPRETSMVGSVWVMVTGMGKWAGLGEKFKLRVLLTRICVIGKEVGGLVLISCKGFWWRCHLFGLGLVWLSKDYLSGALASVGLSWRGTEDAIMGVTSEWATVVTEASFVGVVCKAVLEELGFGGRVLGEGAFLMGAIGGARVALAAVTAASEGAGKATLALGFRTGVNGTVVIR